MILDFSKCESIEDVEAVLRECEGELERMGAVLELIKDRMLCERPVDRAPTRSKPIAPRRATRVER